MTKLHRITAEHLSSTNEKVSERTRARTLEEIYVLAEVEWLRNQPNVNKCMSEKGLQIHAFVYDKEKNGCVRLVESGKTNGAL